MKSPVKQLECERWGIGEIAREAVVMQMDMHVCEARFLAAPKLAVARRTAPMIVFMRLVDLDSVAGCARCARVRWAG